MTNTFGQPLCIVKILFEVKIVTTYNIYLTLDKSEILFIRDSANKKKIKIQIINNNKHSIQEFQKYRCMRSNASEGSVSNHLCLPSKRDIYAKIISDITMIKLVHEVCSFAKSPFMKIDQHE